jgi:uncharacterized YigZ family protein
MSQFSYLTVSRSGTGVYKEKGSRFLSFAYPADSENMVKNRLLELRKEYHDARHHCFAWVLGADKKLTRAFDDGEPGHSAGDPILGQIRSRNLTNVLVVVVRYFGGTKLGVGGLIAAYRKAAADALDHAGIVEKEVTLPVSFQYDYIHTPEAMRLVKEFDLPVFNQDFQERCLLFTEVKLKDKDKLTDRIRYLNAMGVPIIMDV